MKFETPCKLFYVDPFIFIIQEVYIDYAYSEEDGTLFYISQEGAYLQEYTLFKSLNEARVMALKLLDNFYKEKKDEILYSKPMHEEEM